MSLLNNGAFLINLILIFSLNRISQLQLNSKSQDDRYKTFNTSRAVFEHLNRPGASVIIISATQAFVPMAMQAHVGAAKAGVDMLTRTLALELTFCISPQWSEETPVSFGKVI